MSNNILSVLFCVSSGRNDENLGSDELELIFLTFVLIDLNKRKTLDIRHYTLKPRRVDKFGYFLTEECKRLTNMSENKFEQAISLEDALDDVSFLFLSLLVVIVCSFRLLIDFLVREVLVTQ